MKKIILTLCLVALAGCGVSYDGETRLISQLHITDSQGNPIPGLTVAVYVNDDSNSDFEDNSNPANGTTDANGNSLIGFLAPEKSGGRIEILVFEDRYNPINYVNSEITNLRKRDFEGFRLPVNEITMYRPEEVVQLYIHFQQASNTRLVSADLEGEFTTKRFNGYFNDPDNSDISIVAKRNQTVSVNYVVEDLSSGQQNQQTTQITIGDQTVETVINY
ncbi:MAG: hypothetical protein EOO50_13595 [Flavobacterium sp.]|uniref:Ig-like domain-containing protein n=1 Tax=Flavobacterium sp. TaxID=239 RepID=UPI001216BF9E|nr:Ig-like domain-containing protein [Flavobacterium sp.]RZJ65492.1 MAG: hypothetical protein EOO50_13595 [Flavobacterium sp.]